MYNLGCSIPRSCPHCVSCTESVYYAPSLLGRCIQTNVSNTLQSTSMLLALGLISDWLSSSGLRCTHEDPSGSEKEEEQDQIRLVTGQLRSWQA
jgi:hypothetical protein